MGKKSETIDPRQQALFLLPEKSISEPKVRRIQRPIWTENKARLIERYLYYFVMITKHGTYIDAFAGPQEPDKPEMWAAKLVLESKPKWFRHFYLFEQNKNKIKQLSILKDSLPELKEADSKREVAIFSGDSNSGICKLLASNCIGQKEATFCLLDQRTFECNWSTIEALARYKTEGRKIELFYFLANSWLDRALAAQKDVAVLERWWGRGDWSKLRQMKTQGRMEEFVKRFKSELGYESVKPWPIYERKDGGNIMYYMIHATDHPNAPELMSRAYEKAVLPKEDFEQLGFTFDVMAASV